MKHAELLAWLAAPADFAQGAALYAQLGGSAVYQQLFALGETGYSRRVLVEQLQLLTGPVQEPAPEPVADNRQLPTDNSQPGTAPAPDAGVLTGLRAQLKAARDERSQLHAQLTAPGLRVTARCKLAHRICALTDQVQQLLASEQHVLTHGRLPGTVATADVTDAGELRRRLDNLISLRSKVRRRPERAGELSALQAEIDLIRTKLMPTNILLDVNAAAA
ncbi:hypothetical protein [Hymenobacter rigui]|uniref:Uncharacterized protein n=1 Tax=Hymenobacter rigui TaxID=334424 RepID=A0A3R9NWX4_9BACT|nr:hypothetical protein [Hymenobacter rigui]RSK45185.1 hypothetical protein EI291_18920 [Hymenobacter rigui]